MAAANARFCRHVRDPAYCTSAVPQLCRFIERADRREIGRIIEQLECLLNIAVARRDELIRTATPDIRDFDFSESGDFYFNQYENSYKDGTTEESKQVTWKRSVLEVFQDQDGIVGWLKELQLAVEVANPSLGGLLARIKKAAASANVRNSIVEFLCKNKNEISELSQSLVEIVLTADVAIARAASSDLLPPHHESFM